MGDMVKPETLRELVEAGSVRDALVTADGRKWRIEVAVGMTRRGVATRRGELRQWSSLDAVARYLRGMGIARWMVDAAHMSGQEGML